MTKTVVGLIVGVVVVLERAQLIGVLLAEAFGVHGALGHLVQVEHEQVDLARLAVEYLVLLGLELVELRVRFAQLGLQVQLTRLGVTETFDQLELGVLEELLLVGVGALQLLLLLLALLGHLLLDALLELAYLVLERLDGHLLVLDLGELDVVLVESVAQLLVLDLEVLHALALLLQTLRVLDGADRVGQLDELLVELEQHLLHELAALRRAVHLDLEGLEERRDQLALLVVEILAKVLGLLNEALARLVALVQLLGDLDHLVVELLLRRLDVELRP